MPLDNYHSLLLKTQEPNMTKPKLAMLIDALAAGTNLYTPTRNEASTAGTSEVNLLLGELRDDE